MKPEEKAREHIDHLLHQAGWQIQDIVDLNLSASRGVAVREVPLKNGFADYLLFVEKKPVGVVEAKSEGTTLSGAAEQSEKYATGIPDNLPTIEEPLPFVYESTGVETYFRDHRDPQPRSRNVFAFHRPETLKNRLLEDGSLRARLHNLPPLETKNLRECQTRAIVNLEKSLTADKPKALIQMATGSGKTFMAVTCAYRLIKFAGARRILFLVDRNNLGRQTKREFTQYVTPDDGRKLSELYNIQHLNSNVLDPVSKVCISTIQRIYSMLKGEPELDSELEEFSSFEYGPEGSAPREIAYNPDIPIETFDVIITDECHRSIYNLWRQVLEYFDAFTIGLTATPSKQTFGFFNQNLVSEYNHERAVADAVNVGYEVYRIKTKITDQGSKVDAGYYVDKRDKLSREKRWEQLDEDMEYSPGQLDRDVVAPDQIRTIIKTFKEKLFSEIFPGRKEVPKTLIFAKEDSHAEDIVHIVREEFGKGNDFCKKITYRSQGLKPEELIASFRNSYNPRIAVSVDMISTGTDIKPLECLLFMRNIKSRVYFEQMKGRGTRTISETDLNSVTPDATHKTHFVIVDAVGVCENDKTDSRPLERKKHVPLEKLLTSVAMGDRETDTLTTLAGRLAKIERGADRDDINRIEKEAGGRSVSHMVNSLLDAVDPDTRRETAKEEFGTDAPTDRQIEEAAQQLAEKACEPFDSPQLRYELEDVRRKNEQTIDTVSQDAVLQAGFDEQAKDDARTIVDSFKAFIEENRDELTALQIIYNRPYSRRGLTYENIRELADAITKPPYRLNTEQVWNAYRQLERTRVKGAGPQKLLTNIVSLLRFAVGESDVLEPFPETVERRFAWWVQDQKAAGREFSEEQLRWLEMIKDHIAASLAIEPEDFENTPFYQKGGPVRAHQLFGEELNDILGELNDTLAA